MNAAEGHQPGPVGLLYDSLSRNAGDRAIGIALKQALADIGRSGVDEPLPPRNRPTSSTLVVGGGELLRPKGDRFYDAFRPVGRHILNGVAVANGADGLDYLRDYAFVSARTRADADLILRAGVRQVEVVPCLTTMLRSNDTDASATDMIPGDVDQPILGIHVLPSTLSRCPEIVDIVNTMDCRKVLIPVNHHEQDRSFIRSVGFENAVVLDELAPLQLHALVRRLDLLIAASLHASIFAYSQDVPFVCAWRPGVANYFGDRGLRDLVFSDRVELERALAAAAEHPDMGSLVAEDRMLLSQVVERWKDLLESPPLGSDEPSHQSTPDTDADWEREVLEERIVFALRQRDELLAEVFTRQMQLVRIAGFELSQAEAELASVRFHRGLEHAELLDLRRRHLEVSQRLDALMQTRTMRVLRLPRAAYAFARKALGKTC